MTLDVLAAARAAVAERRDDAVATSLALHADPELSMQEVRASARLAASLGDEGFDVESGVAGLPTAFVGRWGTGSPVVALMAEYDALPAIGHACGHNLIAAGGLLAGAAVRAVMVENALPGTVLVVGTPGEEGGGGKVLELEAGVFDGVDAALMFHPSDRTVMTRRMLACLHVAVRFHGVAAHASKNPQDGRNALAAMVQFFVGVDALRQHVPDGARMHGVITNGGAAPNVVPDLTEAVFIVRDTTLDGAEALAERVRAVAEGAATITGTTVEVESTSPPYAHLSSNHALADRVGEHLVALGRDHEPPTPGDATGSTDAGNVSLALPTVHPFVQVAPRGTPSHSHALREAAGTPEAQDAMVDIATALAAAALELLTDPALMAEVKAEFAAAAAQSD